MTIADNYRGTAIGYSFAQPGCFLFRLTPTPLDTTRLKDGVCEIVVTATDTRGNSRRCRSGSRCTTRSAASASERSPGAALNS
jgi:hypothetical protein